MLDPGNAPAQKAATPAAAAAQAVRRAARAANAKTSARALARNKNGRREKSPQEENAENFDKEVHLNCSCHEIPPQPEKTSAKDAKCDGSSSGNNNYSWP